ncbi:MAG: hypothetical protein ACLUFV_01605 [Acutalibacteraceae bacterium]
MNGTLCGYYIIASVRQEATKRPTFFPAILALLCRLNKKWRFAGISHPEAAGAKTVLPQCFSAFLARLAVWRGFVGFSH